MPRFQLSSFVIRRKQIGEVIGCPGFGGSGRMIRGATTERVESIGFKLVADRRRLPETKLTTAVMTRRADIIAHDAA